MDSIKFDKDKFTQLKRQYQHAVDNKLEIFVFFGTEVLTTFAKYLIEHLENEHPDWRVVEVQTEQFQRSAKQFSPNMAVVMYMVDALQYFGSMPKEAIKKIAFEIAMQGAKGYSPEKDGYKISTLPNKDFSGWHILSYYYVSFALALPELLSELRLPYDKEYALAKAFKH